MFTNPIASVVTKALNSALGEYVEGISAESFEISLSKGHIELKGASIRPTVFQSMGLPVELVASHIGSIQVELSFTHLESKPIVVSMRKIFATIKPNPGVDMGSLKKHVLEKHHQMWTEAGKPEEPEKPEIW